MERTHLARDAGDPSSDPLTRSRRLDVGGSTAFPSSPILLNTQPLERKRMKTATLQKLCLFLLASGASASILSSSELRAAIAELPVRRADFGCVRRPALQRLGTDRSQEVASGELQRPPSAPASRVGEEGGRLAFMRRQLASDCL